MGTRAQTIELIRGHKRTEPTDCCCCAVPALLLKPGNTFGPGSRAGRGAGPPYSSKVYLVAIIAATVLSIALRWRLWIHAQRLCPCASQMSSTPGRTHIGSLLKKQNTYYRVGAILHQADISRVRTTYREIIAISDGDIRLDRHLISL